MAKKSVAKKSAVKKTKKTMKKSAAKKTAPKKAAKKATAQKAVKNMKPAGKAKSPKAAPKKSADFDWQDFFTPLDDRVLARVLGQNDRTPGGIIIPDTAQERPNMAEILSVGPGHRDEKGRRKAMDVSIGEKILLTQYTGRSVELRGENLLLVREEDIIGTVK